jgi:ribonuclease P protein component
MRFSVDKKAAKTVRAEGQTFRTSTSTVKYLNTNEYRYSVVLSKKQGTAVQRNRIKRVVREIMRKNVTAYPTGSYIVFIKGAYKEFDVNQVKNDLDAVIKVIPNG